MASTAFVPELLDLQSKVLSTTMLPSIAEVNKTANANETCQSYDFLIARWFEFDFFQKVRVGLACTLFLLATTGNSFVLLSLRRRKTSNHYVMFYLALADLVYACTVLLIDAIWNTTMQWYSGDAICKLGQMLKQFGMYSSSFMVVVIGVDRVTAIQNLNTDQQQKRLSIRLVRSAWAASAICTIPAGVFFSIRRVPTCEGITITQCVDNQYASAHVLQSYHICTMIASFILPLLTIIITYSVIACKISNMKERDRELEGRRNSMGSGSMRKAIKKTFLTRILITISFLVCWGPYYAKGVVDWFVRDLEKPEEAGIVYELSYLLMYFNCVFHLIVFGFFLKKVRQNFFSCLFRIKGKGAERYLSHTAPRPLGNCQATKGENILLSDSNLAAYNNNGTWRYKAASTEEIKHSESEDNFL